MAKMYCAALLLLCLSYSAAQTGTNMFGPEMSPGCLLYPVSNRPEWFQVDIPNYGSRKFPCPMNTLFDVKQCGCGWVDNPKNPPGINTGGRPGGGFGPSGPDEVIPTSELQTTTKPPCKLRRTRDRHYYEQFIVGFDWLLRRCPMGTLYNEEACACHDIDPNQQIMCHPELWLNFNDRDMQDSSGYQIAVGSNGNVQNVSNAGRFDGTGTLTVWQYSNQDLGTEITINLRFYEYMSKEASDEQVLISNCYGRQVGSIEIAINQINKEVIFRGDATLSEPAEVRLPYQEKSWKNVTLTYNGQELTGQVDNEIKSVPLKGHLSLRNHGFLIGSCNGRGYVGYIDDLRLFRCLVDEDPHRIYGEAGSPHDLKHDVVKKPDKTFDKTPVKTLDKTPTETPNKIAGKKPVKEPEPVPITGKKPDKESEPVPITGKKSDKKPEPVSITGKKPDKEPEPTPITGKKPDKKPESLPGIALPGAMN